MFHHIPETYDAWRRCIEIDCAQPLTATFIAQRLTALQDPTDHHTQQFLRRWGPVHHQQVLEWLGRADNELKLSL